MPNNLVVNSGSTSYVTGKFGQAAAKGASFKPATTLTPGATFSIRMTVRLTPGTSNSILFTDTLAYVSAYQGEASINGGTTVASVTVNDGAWHSIELVVVSGGLAKLYVDGILVCTKSAFTFNWSIWVIGIFYDQFLLDGDLDEVAVYNIATRSGPFTPSSSPTLADDAGLVALWRFDGNLNDSAGAADPVVTPTHPADDPHFQYSARFAGTTDKDTPFPGRFVDFGTDADTFTLNLDGDSTDFAYKVDDGPVSRTTVTPSNRNIVVVPARTSTTPVRQLAHLVRVWVAATDGTKNLYGGEGLARFRGVTLPAGKGLLALPPRPSFVAVGDSITLGASVLNTSTPTSDMAKSDATLAWPSLLGDLLGYRPEVVAMSGVGLINGGYGQFPSLPNFIGNVRAGVPWSPTEQPAFVVLYPGTNDVSPATSTYRGLYTNFLGQVRTKYPQAVIYAVVPWKCGKLSPWIAGAVADRADDAIVCLDYADGTAAGLVDSDNADGAHFNPGGQLKLSLGLARDIAADLATRVPAGATSTDPGVANVRSGINYTINDVARVGTLDTSAVPTAQDNAQATVAALFASTEVEGTDRTFLEVLRAIAAEAFGRYDVTSVPGWVIYRLPGGQEQFRYPLTGRTAVDTTHAVAP